MAPHPDYESIIFLPEPDLGDRERPEARIQLKKSMDGTTYTHITQNQSAKKTIIYNFELTRYKALELFDFVDAYLGKQWKITWPTEEIIAYLMVNPLQLEMTKRSVIADNVEAVLLELEFET